MRAKSGDNIPNVNYTVRVIITNLNIRQGPGTNYPIVSVITPGVYTIIEESEGAGASKWGKGVEIKFANQGLPLNYKKSLYNIDKMTQKRYIIINRSHRA